MTEKKSSDATRDTSRKEDANFLEACVNFFREHPAIAASLLYFQVTTVGVIYSWALFRRFDINIFDYAEANDFLLAAFKDPLVFLLSVGTVFSFFPIAIYSGTRVRRRTRERQQLSRLRIDEDSAKPRLSGRALLFIQVAPWLAAAMILIVFIMYTVYIPFSFANSTADLLLSPTAYDPLTSVEYRATSNSKEQTRETGLRVIGTTQSFMFFYDRKDTRTLVIPTAQIVEMEHNGPEGEPKDNNGWF